MGLHSRKEQRFLWTQCHNTFTATKGTPFSHLRTAADPGTLGLTLLAHGCPPQASVAALGCDERTVASGRARAGRHGPAVPEPLVEQPRALGQGQAAALRSKKPGGIVWRALAMRVKTRFWRGGAGSAPRDLRRSRRRIERVKRCAARRPWLVCPEGVVSSVRAIRETFRAPIHTGPGGRPRRPPWRQVLIAQGVKRSERRRVLALARRIVHGTPARVEPRRRRSPGDGGLKTASMERLTATCRQRLAPLARRSRALARRPLTLPHGMSLSGAVYNCWTPHARLTLAPRGTDRGGVPQTPAMAAGIPGHCWSVQHLVSYHVPPPRWTPPKQRGRPAHAFKRLIERWCGHHG
jgi:hypothetical protein